jgi:hypothetical protein
LFLDIVDENAKSGTRQNAEKNHAKEKRGEKSITDLLARKEVMEKARKELPYTFQGKSMRNAGMQNESKWSSNVQYSSHGWEQLCPEPCDS